MIKIFSKPFRSYGKRGKGLAARHRLLDTAQSCADAATHLFVLLPDGVSR